jgi:hypothetical protein
MRPPKPSKALKSGHKSAAGVGVPKAQTGFGIPDIDIFSQPVFGASFLFQHRF